MVRGSMATRALALIKEKSCDLLTSRDIEIPSVRIWIIVSMSSITARLVVGIDVDWQERASDESAGIGVPYW